MEIKVTDTEEKKVDYLKNKSLLYQSILFGDEIRYSDMLAFFIKKFKRNPLEVGNSILNKGKIAVNREKKHTDIWIGDLEEKKYKPTVKDGSKYFEIPSILIETKLKSIAYKSQLESYSKTFSKLYVDAYKEGKRDKESAPITITKSDKKEIEEKIKILKYYLFTPSADSISKDERKINDVKIEVGSGKNREDIDIECTWEEVNYSTVGENIHKIIRKSLNTINQYERRYFEDFANVLVSISTIDKELDDINGHIEDEIDDLFLANETFKNLKLGDLYSKYRASQCAKYLSAQMDCSLKRHWKPDEIEVGSYVISSNFFNGAGLFEVVTKLESGIIYIIQYQDGDLRKGVILTSDNAKRLKNWFIEQENKKWKIIRKNEEKLIELDIKDRKKKTADGMYNKFSYDEATKTKFYYSHVKSSKYKLTLKETIFLMMEYIKNDIPKFG